MSRKPLNKRRFTIRVVLVLLLIGLGFAMYGIGREYTFLLDNGTVEIEGRRYETIAYGSLTVDGDEKKALEIWEGDRLIHKITGASHTFTVVSRNEDDESVIASADRTITLDFNTRQLMISLPAILGGAENFLIENPLYTGEPEPPADDEGEPETEQF